MSIKSIHNTEEKEKKEKNFSESKNNPMNLLKNINDIEANNIEVFSEEEEINMKLNNEDISGINKEKINDKYNISESTGNVMKIFSGEKNDVIDILNEKLAEKEKEVKFLISEMDKIKSKLFK